MRCIECIDYVIIKIDCPHATVGPLSSRIQTKMTGLALSELVEIPTNAMVGHRGQATNNSHSSSTKRS